MSRTSTTARSGCRTTTRCCRGSAPRSPTSAPPSCGSSSRWTSSARTRPAGISNSRDKLRSLQILSRHHIGIPQTTFVRDKKDVLPAIERVGGAPVIIKLLEGTQGIGVLLAESVKSAEAIIELLQSQKQNVLIQKFVAESKGRDIRAFVVGDQVVAAMRRVAQGQEFRSNVHRGGLTEPVDLDEQYRETAVRAAQIMGLRIAGVDMLEGQGRAADHGGELVARPGRNRGLHAARRRRRHHRLHRRPGGLPGDRPAPAADREPRLRRDRDPHPRGLGVRRQDDQGVGAAREGHQRADAVPRHDGDPESALHRGSWSPATGCCASASWS